jgi:6-pyruvoyltetrahydropterin/6-carboxytetrahydropterin synthase
MVYLTRVEHFNAAHRLYNPDWSDEQNEAVFGKCSNANWHGHNFELFVTIKGQPDPQTGFIFDAKKLSSIVRERIVDKVDHRNLNVDVDFKQGKLCSIEHFVMAIRKELEPALPPQVKLHALKLIETPRIYVEYFGE